MGDLTLSGVSFRNGQIQRRRAHGWLLEGWDEGDAQYAHNIWVDGVRRTEDISRF
jgi:hypothetical protein